MLAYFSHLHTFIFTGTINTVSNSYIQYILSNFEVEILILMKDIINLYKITV